MKAVMCMAAPNGARKGKSSHQNIPLTTAELVQTAQQVMQAGACAMHLHIRDDAGRHSLSVKRYQQTLAAIQQVCGDGLLLQVTTEAAGVYSVQQQLELVYQLQPQAVSLSVREIGRAPAAQIRALDRWMQQHHVLPQWIIYDEADVRQYRYWLKQKVLQGKAYPLLFVLGNYARRMDAEWSMLTPLLDAIQPPCWMVCAFGAAEQDIMRQVAASGGHLRVGFENNLWWPDGRLVNTNAELVANSVNMVRQLGGEPATAEQARTLLTPQW